MLSSYADVLAHASLTQGPVAPAWDETIVWLRAHVRPEQRVFFFGTDTCVQFLMRIPPVSRVITGIPDFRSDTLNSHPLILRLKNRMMMDLDWASSEWILLATHDESWPAKTGVASLPSFPGFANFLQRRDQVIKSSQTAYVVFHLRPPA